MSNIRTLKDSGSKVRGTLLFSALCCLVYFTSYMTRINYGAAISEIAVSLSITNQLAGMAVTGSFFAYGLGQPICGYLGDRFTPRNMIFIGLLATSLCNLSISFMSDIYWMTAVWCLNGFFQAMMWPPLVRIMIQNLTNDGYKRTSVGVVSAASIGTIIVYVLVPLCIVLSGWRLAFVIPAFFGLLVAFVWFYGVKYATDGHKPIVREVLTQGNGAPRIRTLILSAGLLPIMLAIVLQGALRDGIATWMPTFINDTYNFGTAVSILITGILPIITIVSISVSTVLQKAIRNELKSATYIWALSFIAALALIVVSASNVVLSVIFMGIIAGCMHGVNMMLVGHLPLHFARFGRTSTMSGILNAFTYIGSAISIYGFAALSDHFGWKYTIGSWIIIIFFGMVICAMCIKIWGRFAIRTDLDEKV